MRVFITIQGYLFDINIVNLIDKDRFMVLHKDLPNFNLNNAWKQLLKANE
jgi:hypothetical protein